MGDLPGYRPAPTTQDWEVKLGAIKWWIYVHTFSVVPFIAPCGLLIPVMMGLRSGPYLGRHSLMEISGCLMTRPLGL